MRRCIATSAIILACSAQGAAAATIFAWVDTGGSGATGSLTLPDDILSGGYRVSYGPFDTDTRGESLTFSAPNFRLSEFNIPYEYLVNPMVGPGRLGVGGQNGSFSFSYANEIAWGSASGINRWNDLAASMDGSSAWYMNPWQWPSYGQYRGTGYWLRVPEPGTLLLVTAALAAGVALRRRRAPEAATSA